MFRTTQITSIIIIQTNCICDVSEYIRNIQQIEEVRDKTKEETIKYEDVKDKVQNE